MGKLTYRSTVYRGTYALAFVGAYLLLVAYVMSGDDSGSSTNAGVWAVLLGMLLCAVAGAVAGPSLHRRIFKHGVGRQSRHRHHSDHHMTSKE